jgi:hypothetical protein
MEWRKHVSVFALEVDDVFFQNNIYDIKLKYTLEGRSGERSKRWRLHLEILLMELSNTEVYVFFIFTVLRK